MLHVVENLLPTTALNELRDLCDIPGRLKEQHSAMLSSAGELRPGHPFDPRNRPASHR